MKTISLQTLREHKACARECLRFEKLFGNDPIEVTEEKCVEHFNQFSWAWAADILLSATQTEAFLDETSASWHELDRNRAAAWSIYYDATSTHEDRKNDPQAAWETYSKAVREQENEHYVLCAKAFAKAYNL